MEELLGAILAIQTQILAIQTPFLAIQQTIFVGSRKWLYFCIVFQDGGWDWTPQPRAWKMD